MSIYEIPELTLTTWKMFNHTITSITTECSEDSLKRLAKIIKNMLNFFIPNNNIILSKNYDDVTNKYKTFNTWVLGQLFYISIHDKKHNAHDLVVEMQLWILEQLAKTQLHMCIEISEEYYKIMQEIIRFLKSKNSGNIALKLFAVDQENDLNNSLNLNPKTIELTNDNLDFVTLKTIICLKFFLLYNYKFIIIKNWSMRLFDDLLFLFCECNMQVKFEIFTLYLDLMKQINNTSIASHEFDKILLNFKQLTNEIYSNKIVLNESELIEFEELLLRFLEQNNKQKNCAYIINCKILNNIQNPKLITKIFQQLDKLPEFYSINFNDWINNVIRTKDISTFIVYKNIIIKDINNYFEMHQRNDIRIFEMDKSEMWSDFVCFFMNWANQVTCSDLLNFLNILSDLFIQIKIELPSTFNISYFDEQLLLSTVLLKFQQNVDLGDCLRFLANFPLFCGNKHLQLICELLEYLLVDPMIKKGLRFSGDSNRFCKKEVDLFLEKLDAFDDRKDVALEYLNRFLVTLGSRLFEFDNNFLHQLENKYLRLSRKIMEGQDVTLQCLVIKNLDTTFYLLNSNDIIGLLLCSISSKNSRIQKEILKILPKIVCLSSSNHIVRIFNKLGDIQLIFECCECNNISKEATEKNSRLSQKINVNNESLEGLSMKIILQILSSDNEELQIIALNSLPYYCSHISKFNSARYIKLWVEKCGDNNLEIRRSSKQVIGRIIRYGQKDTNLTNDNKHVILNTFLEYLLLLSKKSLKDNHDMQLDVLQIIEEVLSIKSKIMLVGLLKILLYFIMLLTSKHSWIAINKFKKIADDNSTTTHQLYKQHKEDFCEIIAHLCAINQHLINWSLLISLQKLSGTLGYSNSKEFISRECRHLLPFLVSKIVKMPAVKTLIEEVAAVVDVELSELLANNYGNIFLRIFLYDTKEDFKFCMEYVEKNSNLTGPVLRKRNMRVILNELLINLHQNKDKVLLALKLLAREDPESNNSKTIKDYLSSRLLGILHHFDLSLALKTRTDTVLESLADLMKFMGPGHIGPLRFKIIAMLRTVNYEEFPHLGCDAWDAFIHSCEIDILGQHLATIFVSLLPLISTNHERVNNIFRYLVLENETINKDYIKDLFFLVDDNRIDSAINVVIKKYANYFNNLSLKMIFAKFLKYLQHETVEVRVFGLNYLKKVISKNRIELDKMILGYNGIDPIIVEIVKVLIQGSREKDYNLKLACGDVIGELGAIEPSHLPRSYVETRNFTFFINDNEFVINVLNELIKSLQRERNTYDLDRYSLAIQEYLKIYDISPESHSKGNHIWQQIPESQRELIIPFLTSKYIMKPTIDSDYPTPIYGSHLCTSFQGWLYNWSVSLILTLPQNLQSILNICLPAMKQDYKILMLFLPHILLHSLIEGASEAKEKISVEINTIITTFINRTSNYNSELISASNFSMLENSDDVVSLQQCLKTIFVLLDFLDRWIREWQWQKCNVEKNKTTLNNLKAFLNRFCKLQLAKCNYYCAEYPRSLLYLEEFMNENQQERENYLSLFAEIYAQLDESDGVAGVMALRHNKLSIEEHIRALEVSGKLTEAICCYQRLSHPLKLPHFRGLVQCNLYLDQVHSALHIVNGALDECIDYGTDLFELQSEIFWRLGRFEDLNTILNKSEMVNNSCWGVQIARALLYFKNQNRDQFKEILDFTKTQQIEYLGNASLEESIYQHGYSYIARLHALNELQQIENVTYEILENGNEQIISKLTSNLAQELETRIKVVQESIKIIEPLLCLRRVALGEAKKLVEEKVPVAAQFFNSMIGSSWLKSAKIARDVGNPQAYSYIIKAEEFDLKELFLEKAKLHWSKAEHEDALKTLQRGLDEVLPSKEMIDQLSLEQRKICAEAKLLIATYNDSLSMVNTENNISNYKESLEIYKEWEVNLVTLGQFFDKIFQNMTKEEQDTSRGSDMQIHIINYFGKSLQYGTSYVYQSMPRMLSIWFDFGTRLLQNGGTTKNEGKSNLLRMTRLIDSFLERLPAYIFLTAFSQLVSRICHPQKEVYSQLKMIIIKLLLEYPQQSLWMIISVAKSSYAIRAKRCSEILSDARLKSCGVQIIIKDFIDLAEKLIELCNKDIAPEVNTTTVSSLVRGLPRLLSNGNFSEIMIPTNKFRKLVLPNPDFSSTQHNPFPNHYVHIAGIEEEMTILHSLQRPRKITFRGSDGKKYVQMLKANDDLRKDFRLMEFNDIVNQLLSREPEARQKRLNIRLYSVSPLNEECGLIEWIPNLVGLRPVLMTIYKQIGKGMRPRELREASCNIRDPLAKKREVFLNKLLPNHPAVLGEWFRITFPDAQSWVMARTAYIRTTAVMSMAGYILGLGDRHGENILLDSICGDSVHVDFNCLFNKGETFEWPERVPFRLTHNMVAAMGPLGVEGIFRTSCVCTLKVLRTNTNTLMSIVTPFVYDPLVSWPKNPARAGSDLGNAERTNEQAVDHIKNIELRLKGVVKTRNRTLSIPLSVDGQTNHLINEAMSVDNLCQMYIGWGPYL